MTTDRTLRVNQRSLAVLQYKVEQVAKVARKLGQPEPTLVIHKSEMVQHIHETLGTVTWHKMTTCEVLGVAPRLEGGWQVLGCIDLLDDGVVTRFAPEADIDASQFENTTSHCDHCQTQRQRNKVIVLRNEDGDIKRIGSTCIKDYMGHRLPDYFDLYEIDTQVDDEEFMRMTGSRYAISPEEFLLAATWATATFGYKNKQSIEQATASKAHLVCIGHRSMMELLEAHPITNEIREEAAKVVEWLTTTESDNDFIRNAKVIMRNTTLNDKHHGILAAIPFTYQREIERQNERDARQQEEAEMPETPVVEGRITITGTVLSIREREGHYGIEVKMTVLDDRGFKVWGSCTKDCAVGDKVTFVATVNKSDRDEHFGFFKRPTKFEVLASA